MQEKYKNIRLPARERAESLLQFMTVKEKIGQLNQRLYGFSVYELSGNEILLSDELKEEVRKYDGLGTLYGLYRADPWSKRNYENGLTNEMAPKAYNHIQRYVLEHSRLKIPFMLSTECPHGHQALDGYLLPVNLALGATFHPALVEKAYSVCGKQLNRLGVDMALVSTLDVMRDPRWGRSEECYSEDPYLAAKMGQAAVDGIQKQGVAVVAKHFCAQGEGTGGINASAARIGERELREIHYPPAKACCEAKVQGVMAAYNEIDGVYCHANHKLLTEVLRGEMGFDGIIMSDGTAIDRLDQITGDNRLSGAKALKAGVDIGLWDNGFGRLEEALEAGFLEMEDIDRAVLRVLTMKFERGLFEHPYIEESCRWQEYSYESYPEALDLARESAVLLKNDHKVLPIRMDNIKSIAVIGPNADEIYNQLGDYTPPIKPDTGITVLRGIKEYLEKHNSGIEVKFAAGSSLQKDSMAEAESLSHSRSAECIEEACQLAGSCDLTILVLGGSSSRFHQETFDINGAAIVGSSCVMDCGEGVDCSRMNLPDIQEQLAFAIFNTKAPVITVMIQGRPYAIPEIAERSSGLLCCFYPGIKGGQAIAEILFGSISPSGRLPVSIPRHSGQLPSYYNYKASYKAMNYYDSSHKPLFTFGDGLSYTEFQYKDIWIENQNITLKEFVLESVSIKIHFTVENTGDKASYTVPQLYIQILQSSIVTRVKELKSFSKIWLKPGQSQDSCFIITKEALSVWNENMEFAVEPGEKYLYLCDSGKEIWKQKMNILRTCK